MTSALLFIAVLLVIGVILRKSVPLFRWLYIPASVIAGMLGLLVIQLCLSNVVPQADGEVLARWSESQAKILAGWPGWLIAVVFAGMLIDRKPTPAGESVRRVARQGIMVWVIVLGETAVGLLAVWLLIQPLYDVPNSLGMLIETGFAGGHGTAAAMGQVFSHPDIQLDEGRDLGMLMATFGLVLGIVMGILWINIGVRRQWIAPIKKNALQQTGNSWGSIGTARISGDTLDPLLLQVIWLALAFGAGLLMQQLVTQFANGIDSRMAGKAKPMVVEKDLPVETDLPDDDSVNNARQELEKRLKVSSVADFPLFIYTLVWRDGWCNDFYDG